jgi:hypothetical protein
MKGIRTPAGKFFIEPIAGLTVQPSSPPSVTMDMSNVPQEQKPDIPVREIKPGSRRKGTRKETTE